jgi:hypothetical protein
VADEIQKNIKPINLPVMINSDEALSEARDFMQRYTRLINEGFEPISISGKNVIDATGEITEQTVTIKALNEAKQESVTLTAKLYEEEQKVSKITVDRKSTVLSSDDITKQVAELENLGHQMDNIRNRWSAMMLNPQYAAQWRELRDEINSVLRSGDTSNLDKTIERLKQSYKGLSAEVKANSLDQKAFGDVLATTSRRLMAYMTSVLSIGMAMRQLRQMIQDVREIDAAQVRLARVTDLTGNAMDRFTKRAFEAGQQIGRTGKDVLDAVTEFRRAGFELEQSFQMAQGALIMTNIGDGIRDVAEASSALIAVLRGFQFDESEYRRVIDAINEVSNTAPIGFANITDGLRRVSGTLSQTNTSIEETIGLLTGGFASLRNIENVSAGLVMISQRKISNRNANLFGVASYVEKSA